MKEKLARWAISQAWGWRGDVLLFVWDNNLQAVAKAVSERDALALAASLTALPTVVRAAFSQYQPAASRAVWVDLKL